MRVLQSAALALLMSAGALSFAAPATAQAYQGVGFDVRVRLAPPPLPAYDQPEAPGYGYIWTPGYWAWDDDQGDYYWVDGQWVEPPQEGYLWTPGYWGYDNGYYAFNQGYWGPSVGYYGGINYGFGYGGYGYDGGYWRGRDFYYNRQANHFRHWDFGRDYDRPLDNDWRRHDHDNDRRSFGDEHDRGQGWNRGANGRVDDHNRFDRNGATVQGQQGWNRGANGRVDDHNRFDRNGATVQGQQGWARGADGVRVQPQQGQLNGRQPYPPANGGGADRSGWRQQGGGAPTTPQNYGGPRQTYTPQAGYMGRPQGVQGQPPPRQTFQSQPPRQTFAAPQPQRQAPPQQRQAPPARNQGDHQHGDRPQ